MHCNRRPTDAKDYMGLQGEKEVQIQKFSSRKDALIARRMGAMIHIEGSESARQAEDYSEKKDGLTRLRGETNQHLHEIMLESGNVRTCDCAPRSVLAGVREGRTI